MARSRLLGWLAALALAGAVAVLALGPLDVDAHSPHGPKVMVRTTGNNSELRNTVPITGSGSQKRRVIMSLSSRKLPGLRAGDRLEATAELQVTTDCHYRSPRCAGRPYLFNPTVDAWVMLARGPHVTGGAGAMTLAHTRITCYQEQSNYEHHCVIVFTHAATRISSLRGLPCRPASCTLNFVVAASNPQASRGDRLVIGGNLPDGTIRQDKGRLNAIRFRPASQPPVPARVSHARVHRSIPENGHRVVVFSQRLGHLDRNDQLAVMARMRTNVSPLPYDVRLTSQLILASGPDQTGPSGFSRRVSLLQGQVTEANGSNCTQHMGRCTRLKTGVTRMLHAAVDRSGRRVPLYVNYVARSNPKEASARPGDRLPVLSSGGIHVIRYPAALRG